MATFDGNNRLMLQQIRDSLSYLQKPKDDAVNQPGAQNRDLNRSAPNVADKTGKLGTGRDGYRQHALAQIRQSLAKFQVGEQSNSPNLDAGFGVTEAKRFLQTISDILGCDEVCEI